MWDIHQYDELPSTQSLAKERLLSGKAKDSDVFVAHHQTEGKGRYSDREWIDEPGKNLLMSIVMTDIPEQLKDKMQFVAALSVLRMIRSLLHVKDNVYPGNICLKWTNDILINEKKVAGVMTDAIWSGSILKGVVIGIGINVNQEHFPPEISDTAISLKDVTEQTLLVQEICDLELDELASVMESFQSKKALISDLRKELDWMRSTKVFSLTETDGTKFSGLRYDGISDEGALIVLAADGEKRMFQSGSLQFQ